MKLNQKIEVLVGLFVLLILAAAYSYYNSQKIINTELNQGPISQNNSNSGQNAPGLTVQAIKNNIVSGDQYGLFILTQYDKINNFIPEIKYSDDGVIASGKYTGYHRFAATISEDSPGGPSTYVFATKDYQSFVLAQNINDYTQRAFNDPDTYFNKSKISALDDIPLDFPDNIDLGNFVLLRQEADWMPPTASEQLPSSVTGLTFYSVDSTVYGDLSQYFSAGTTVDAQDSNGLIFTYLITTKPAYLRSQGQIQRGTNFYLSSELAQANIYDSYGVLLPGGCSGLSQSYILKDVNQNDLIPVTRTNSGLTLYTFKDKNNQINGAEYKAKVTAFADSFSLNNNGAPMPSFDDYVAKNPVLLVQDPWGRWLGLGETQYLLPGGCGKPVIYLYPQVPTNVSLEFENPVKFNQSIPTYDQRWYVQANPDGQLKDLQPFATNCSKINYSQEGSEYAKSACASGTYPYLYWSGQTTGLYPQMSQGWVVKAGDLQTFMDSKLSYMGLNDKERNDMISFWVPEMLKKNTPYYRISFLQTQDLNKLFPMRVRPQPDTVFRIFLDWQPLQNSIDIQPQTLQQLVRKGFTMVEWGGLRQ